MLKYKLFNKMERVNLVSVNCVPTKVDGTKTSISKFFIMVKIVCCFSKLIVGE